MTTIIIIITIIIAVITMTITIIIIATDAGNCSGGENSKLYPPSTFN